MTSLLIIGAGPAGLTAAIFAARQGARVTLVDANPIIGRKLLVSGAGRCNLTNIGAVPEAYETADPEALAAIFRQFDREDLLVFLEDIGIPSFQTDDGWYYPLSESATTVVDSFSAALAEAGVEVHLNRRITAIQRTASGFRATSEGGVPLDADRLFCAFGGKAAPALGTTGNLWTELAKMGHTLIPPVPGLAPITVDTTPIRKLQGVRLDMTARLMIGDKVIAQSTGNAIFTEFGLNGPAVMNISHQVGKHAGEPLTLSLNLLPGVYGYALHDLMARKKGSSMPLRAALGAVLPPKVPPYLMECTGLPLDLTLAQSSKEQRLAVLQAATDIRLKVTGTRGFEFAQSSFGGVPLTEIDPASMASRRVPGLYLAGEVLEVACPCGGYHLQFMFSTGAVAGMATGAASD